MSSSLVLLLAASGSPAEALTYPGPPPCDTTLQACIEDAAPGDVIQIATNGVITEDVTVAKSLTLEPAMGFTPTIAGRLFIEGGATATAVTVQRLTINGTIAAQPGAGAFEVHILKNTVTLVSSFGLAIEVQSGTSPPYGDVVAEISGNTVSVTGTSGFLSCGGILVGPKFDAGTTTAVISGNQVSVVNCGQGFGILALNGRGEAMTVDIVGNRVDATDSNNGIEARNFQQEPNSTLDARIVNNVVTGQIDVAGFPGGIVVSADGFESITAQVINNTVVGNASGIGVSARTDLGASITGVVANNIVADNSQNGVFIDEATEPTVSNDHNLLFNNGASEFTPGPGTVTQDPLFVSPTDFHLQLGSPAIDAGNNDRVPPGIVTDLDGNPRIVPPGGIVDIGAYENQEQTTSTTSSTTTSTTSSSTTSSSTSSSSSSSTSSSTTTTEEESTTTSSTTSTTTSTLEETTTTTSTTTSTPTTSTTTTTGASTSSTSTTVPSNRPPDCAAAASPDLLSPPNHDLVAVAVEGVSDPDGDPVAITITGITQDEPVLGVGSGSTCPDATGVGTGEARVRVERSGQGDGRVYHVGFEAEDGRGGRCVGTVTVCVARGGRRPGACVDQGPIADATGPCEGGCEDGDPCIAGLCPQEEIPRALGRHFERARRLLERAADSGRARKTRTFVARARKVLEGAARKVAAAAKRRAVSVDCAAALGDALGATGDRTAKWLDAL